MHIEEKNNSKIDFLTDTKTFYTIGFTSYTINIYNINKLPLIGEYCDIWYPVINIFNLNNNNIAIYSYDDSYFNNKDRDFSQKFIEIFQTNDKPPIGFRAIASLLIQDKVFDNIVNIINDLPESIQSEIYGMINLSPISEQNLKKYNESKDKTLLEGTIYKYLSTNSTRIILKNNILVSLYIIFKKRYEELKSNGFRDFIFKEEDEKERFNKKIKEMRMKYFCMNDQPKIKDRFENKDELYLTKRFISTLEKENKNYIKQNDENCFEKIKIMHYNNKLCFNSFTQDESQSCNDSTIVEKESNNNNPFTMMITSDIILPQLTRPENDLTLNHLINFYNDAIKITRILPIFLRNVLKNNDEQQQKEAEECFSLLINSYKAFKPDRNSTYKDTSFLSYYVNEFINSFEKMISKLKKAGLNTMGLGLESIQTEENTNEILKIPEYEEIDEKNNFWNIFKKKNFNELNKPFYDTIAYTKTLQENKDILKKNDYDASTYDNKIDIVQTTTKTDKPISNPITKRPSNPINPIPKPIKPSIPTLDKNKLPEKDIPNKGTDEDIAYSQTLPPSLDDATFVTLITDNPNPSDSPSDNNNNNTNNNTNNNNPVMKLNSNAMSKMTIKPKSFGNKNILFNEKDGIEKSIMKIKAMDENEKFSCDYKMFDNYYPKEIESIRNDPLKIEKMISNSISISQMFIKFASENDIPFSNEGVAILIDCSGYINKENKLFNMYLICGLTEGLNAIGIPYSVALISDENFKRIIKKYDTPHNKYELQKIYECYMIQRYRTNLAKSLKFGIDNLKFDSNISTEQGKINSNTTYLIFTDGMDENLYFGKDFKDYLFNDPHLSFCFSFIKSNLLNEDHIKILEDLWTKFNDEKKGSISKAQINIFESKLDLSKIKDFVKMFVHLLSRNIEEQNYKIGNYPIEKPSFEMPNKDKELDPNSFAFIKDSLILDYSKDNDIFYNISQICYGKQKSEKLDSSLYNNRIGKILDCRINNSIVPEYNKFLNEFIIPKNKINMSLLDQIFLPNKASTMVLSTTGTEIDIPAFIKYLFENSPNPMIYLEKKGGFTKHYSVSIVIDSSFSCLNKFSFSHTIQTIRVLISSIAAINIPAVDIVIATGSNPIVICSDVASTKLLGKTNILNSIFKVLSNPCLKANLISALKVAKELQKIGSKDTTKYMFVLTDGLYQQNEIDLIKNRIFECMQTSMLIGIGIGFYPLKINKLFVQNIYCKNPFKLFSGISISTAKSNDKYISKMENLDILAPNQDVYTEIIDELVNTDNPINKELIKELDNIEIEMDAFSDFYNAEKEQYDSSGTLINPIGKNTSMYSENELEGHELLFVCLYNCDMNENEDPHTNHKYLFEQSPKAYYYFDQCAKYYGVKIKLVLNYEDAIIELTKPWDKDNSKCKYYACWIVCGPPYPMLPDNGGKKSDPYLLGEFLKVIEIFNQNGGSLIFLTESDPLYYQANLFLRNLYLYEKNGNNKVKVDLQLEGEHQGDTILKGDKTGLLNGPGLFNKSAQSFKNLTRSTLSHNLVSYYEGYTIDYADYDKIINSPFYPFARDSEGGVAGFFYPADQDGRGDIIINCSYTSLYFTKKENDGTYRYYENIIAWTARPEIHIKYDQCNVRDYRPKKVNYTINYNNKWTEFKELPKKEITEADLLKMKTLFCVDASGSVGSCTLYHNVTRNIFNKFHKYGDLIYLWGSSYKQITESEFRTWNNNKDSGLGGTASELIADIASKERYSNIEHLIIITDGSVNSGSIDASDSKMQSNGIHFKFVSTYIIGSGGDRSVGAPYCRGDPNVTYVYRSETNPEKLASLGHKELSLFNNFDSQITTYSQFIQNADMLKNVFEAYMYGKNADSNLMNRLNTLKRKITSNSLSTYELDNFNNIFNAFYHCANGGLRDGGNLEFGAKKKQ